MDAAQPLRRPWRMWSGTGSRRPMPARTCSSAGAASWMTGPATWPAGVEGRRPQQRSMAFPPGITVEGATPDRGGKVSGGLSTLPPARGAPAPKNPGSLPPLPPPPVPRHDALCEAADTRCRHRTGLYPGGLGQSVPTRVQCGFPGTAWTTTARAAPSEREALRWSKACATW